MVASKRYRIGEFARLGAASVKTLRYYDELGLLKPAHVDARTQYRYYDSTQLRSLAAIRALKDLGATLGEIRSVLPGADSGLKRRHLLARLRNMALHSLANARRSVEWIDLELEDGGHSLAATPVVLKQRAEIRIASIRAQLRTYAEIEPVERDLTQALRPALAGEQRGVLWHRCEASGVIEGEPFVEVRGAAPRGSGFELRCLPGARVASAYCETEDVAAARTYDTIDRWVHGHDLRLDGPKRELYVGQLLEIQFPVRPA